MKKLVSILLNIFLVLFLSSCVSKSNFMKKQGEPVLEKGITLLIFRGMGGPENVIRVSKDGKLIYFINIVYAEGPVLDGPFDENPLYNVFRKRLKRNVVLELNKLVKDGQSFLYHEKMVVKDGMQHYIYLDGVKQFFGYQHSFDEYPSNAKKLINILLKEVGKVYELRMLY